MATEYTPLDPLFLEGITMLTPLSKERSVGDVYVSPFKKRCTKDFTERYLIKIKEMREWLLQQIQL